MFHYVAHNWRHYSKGLEKFVFVILPVAEWNFVGREFFLRIKFTWFPYGFAILSTEGTGSKKPADKRPSPVNSTVIIAVWIKKDAGFSFKFRRK